MQVRCVDCRQPHWARELRDGLCGACRRIMAEEQAEAAIQAKCEAAYPRLHRDLRLLERFEGVVRQHIARYGEQPVPDARRHRHLAEWQREQPAPLVYDGDE
jgi:hypothetical protein